MANTRIIYRNLWRTGTLLAVSSEDPQFPKEYTQSDDTTLAWHSRNGTGSGNGLFVITTANHHLDYDIGAAELNAIITAGSYNGTTLAAEIQTQLNATGGTFTVTYSLTTGKFTIARAAGNFTLRWQSGANTAATIGTAIGFIITADDTGAATYTSDYARFHYPAEYIDIDLAAATVYDYVALLGHNLSATAVATIYGADDSAFTTNVVSDVITYAANNMRFYLAAARTKRYVRIHIADPTNASGYVKIGNVVVGKYYDLAKAPAAEGYEDGYDDFTEIEFSASRNLHIVQDAPILKSRALSYIGLTDTTKGYIMDLLSHCGIHRAFDICFDYSYPNTYTWWVNLAEAVRPQYLHPDYWNWPIEIKEHV